MTEITVIGTGYVGIVTAGCLAERGNNVMCVDISPEKVDMINAGRAPITEPGLDSIIQNTVRQGTLRATTNLGEAVSRSDVILLSLPTPPYADGSADLRAVFNIADRLGEYLRPEAIVANRSTVPIGTTRRMGAIIAASTSKKFYPVSNPEFLAEGSAVLNTSNPDRIVLGVDSTEPHKRLRELWRPFVHDDEDNKIIFVDPESAETIKMAANTHLAAQIVISNIIAEICERTGANYRSVQGGVSKDRRIGKFLHPSPGYGGSCFPKDVRSMAAIARELGIDSTVLDSLSNANESHKLRWSEKIKDHFDKDLKNKTIAVWGLSFKPKTDDVREAAAKSIIEDLLAQGASIRAYDPDGMQSFDAMYNLPIEYAEDKFDAARGADAVIILTEWGIFETTDPTKLKEVMRGRSIFDARAIINTEEMSNAGFYCDVIGRRPIDGRWSKEA